MSNTPQQKVNKPGLKLLFLHEKSFNSSMLPTISIFVPLGVTLDNHEGQTSVF
jgi:hypothetical protein